MDTSRRSQFEQIVVVALLVVFGMAFKGLLQQWGILGRRANQASVPAAPAAAAPVAAVSPAPSAPPQASPTSRDVLAAEPRLEAVYTADTFRDPFKNLVMSRISTSLNLYIFAALQILWKHRNF